MKINKFNKLSLKLSFLAVAIAGVIDSSAYADGLWSPSPYEQQSDDRNVAIRSAPVAATKRNEIMGMTASVVADGASGDVQNARPKAVFEAAQTYAAQTAYCERAEQIKQWADSQSAILDRVFAFSNLLLDGGRVLPPVIEQADASFKQGGDNEAVTAQTTWHILNPARIVSTAPNWRSYLYVSCPAPLKPNPVLIPGSMAKTANSDESAWKKGVVAGWTLGYEQAFASFKYGMNALTRDYIGMLRFYSLNRRGIVSTPILARGDVGIRVEGRTLNVGETVFRLTGNADWKPADQWKP
jgi:defect-in-organelle-trafficking protein DotC